MSLLDSSIFCVIFCLTIYVENCSGVLIYGCEFESKASFTLPAAYNHIEKEPVYGSEVPAQILDGDPKVFMIVREAREIIKNILHSNPYSTIESFHRFYKRFHAYRFQYNQITINFTYPFFKAFYDKHSPSLFHDDGAVGLVAKILKNLVQNNSDCKYHVYMATVYADASEEFVSRQQKVFGLHKDFIHNHLAVIYKFELDHDVGYIVMDAVHGLMEPVVMMKGNLFDIRRGAYVYRWLPFQYEDSNGTIHFIRSNIIQAQYQFGALNSHLYYIHLPFCSAMKLTFRNELLNPLKKTVVKHDDGATLLAISAELLPNVENPKITFNVRTRNQPYVMPIVYFTKSNKLLDEVLTEAAALLPRKSRYLNVDKCRLYDKLQRFTYAAIDNTFLSNFALLIYQRTGRQYNVYNFKVFMGDE